MKTLLKQFHDQPGFTISWFGISVLLIVLWVLVPSAGLIVYGALSILLLALYYFQRKSRMTTALMNIVGFISIPLIYHYLPIIGWLGVTVWAGIVIFLIYLFVTRPTSK